MSTTDELIINRVWCKAYTGSIRERLDIPDVSLHEYVLQSAAKFRSYVATVFLDSQTTYEELAGLIMRFASGLRGIGIGEGDRVALMLPNSLQFIIAYFASLSLGGVVVPLNPLYKSDEAGYILKDSGAKALVVMDLFYDVAEKAVKGTGVEKLIVTSIADLLPSFKRLVGTLLRKIPSRPIRRAEGVLRFKDLLGKEPIRVEDVTKVDPSESLAVICYTSGTTGMPKGAMLTHKNLVADIEMSYEMLKQVLEPGKETVLAILPFFHIYGQTTVMGVGLSRGFKLVIIPKPDMNVIVNSLRKMGITLFLGVPHIYNALINIPNVGELFKGVKLCISGADKLHVEVASKFRHLTGIEIVEGYGLTETSPVTHLNPIGRVKHGSIGVPIPNTYAWVINPETNVFAKVGDVGEIVIAGPQVMKGYLNRPEDTREAFFKALGKTWFKTGDLGYVDDEGYFYVVERKKDLIKYKGWSIYPAEIESVAYKHEAVKVAAAVGVPEREVGERIFLYIELKEEFRGKISEEDMAEWLKDKLAPFQMPHKIIFKRSIPVSMTGKVLRRLLREEAITSGF